MILEIVKYGTPVLRQKGARIEKVTAEVKQLIADMFETMEAAKGVGLAAQQVGHAIQLAVLDVRGITDRPSQMEIDGKEVDIDEHMPLALINPQVKLHGDKILGPEGCLSFPEIYAEIARPAITELHSLNEKGEPVEFRCSGLLARALQHEVDHLNGILFIDRMSREEKDLVQAELEELQAKTKAALKKKK